MSRSFQELKQTLAQKRLEVEQRLAGDNPLSKLDHFSNRILFKFDPGFGDGFSRENMGDTSKVVASLLVNFSHELLGFLWVIRGGSIQAAYGHVRAMLETQLATEYIFARTAKNPEKKREDRIRKYLDFSSASRLAWIRRNNLPHDRIIELCGSQAAFDALEAKQADWEKLYGLKKAKKEIADLYHWHAPAQIDHLFDSTANPAGLRRFYEVYCHAIHVSPIGYKLAGDRPALVGFTADKIQDAAFNVWLMCILTFRALGELDNEAILKPIEEDVSVLDREVRPMYRAARGDGLI